MQLFLSLHIAGSFVFIGYMMRALHQLILAKGTSSKNAKWAVGIGGFQTLTGFAMAFTNPSISLSAVCIRGLLLIAILVIVTKAVTWRLAYQPAD